MITTLAGRQKGVVARWQLLAAGVSRHQVALRLAAGRLYEMHPGVYLVGHEVAPMYVHEAAAVLACRGHATISHAGSTACPSPARHARSLKSRARSRSASSST